MTRTTATVRVKADTDIGKKVVGEQIYQKIVFGEPKEAKPEELLRDAIGFLQKEAGEKGNGVLELLNHVTYSYDLGQRSTIRQAIVAAIEGPEKAIERTIDNICKTFALTGREISREAARAFLMPAVEATEVAPAA
jgi:hypothetical protein